MEIAKVQVSGVCAIAVCKMPIPKGIIGAQVRFEYTDPMWDGLSKTVVFQGSGVTKDVLDAGELVTVPAEVVAWTATEVRVGVYGTDADNNIAIPTLWARLGVVKPAADPSGDESTDPSLPVWAQLDNRVSKLEKGGTGSGGGLSIDSDGEGNVTITASGSATITSDGAGNVAIA